MARLAVKRSISIPDNLLDEALATADYDASTLSAVVQASLRLYLQGLGPLSFMAVDWGEGIETMTIETSGHIRLYERRRENWGLLHDWKVEDFTRSYGYIEGKWRLLTNAAVPSGGTSL